MVPVPYIFVLSFWGLSLDITIKKLINFKPTPKSNDNASKQKKTLFTFFCIFFFLNHSFCLWRPMKGPDKV